ncbi:MAG: hypothetical protein H6707_20365 [Deltaproteobacteria bacterium]|nr:hypothetical protein [Deltaproteobacteria bacterium]
MTDAGTTDARTTDASPTDASTTDASTTDASTTDASSTDGGSACEVVTVVNNGLAVGLTSAYDMPAKTAEALSYSTCGQKLTFSASKNPADTVVKLSPTGGATQLFGIWASDTSGHQTSAETYALIQTQTGPACAPVAIAYSGLVVDVSHGPVELPAAVIDAGSSTRAGCPGASSPLKLSIGISGGTLANSISLSDKSSATTLVTLEVSDGVNSTRVETYVLVQANVTPKTPGACAPAPVAMNGLAVGLPPSGAAGIPVRSFERGSVDRCSAGGLVRAMRRAGDTTPVDFSADTIKVSCKDSGTQIIEYHIRDNNSATTYVESYALVQGCP